MIYNKGVATTPGTASGRSLVSRAGSPGSGQPHATTPLVLTLEEGFGQQRRVFPCSPRDRHGSERWRFSELLRGAREQASPRRPSRIGCARRGHTDPVLVMLGWGGGQVGWRVAGLKHC